MNTGDLLLRAVLCNPGDDTARLAYADWREENGDLRRAGFVREQVRLALLRGERTDLFNDDTDWSKCEAVSANWCSNCGDCCCKHAWPDFGPRNDPACPLHAPDSPHARWDELAGEIESLREAEAELFDADTLPGCGGQLREWYFECYPDGHTPDRPFSFLLNKGFVDEVRLPADAFTEDFARELFGRHPVTRVVLTDREPWQNYYGTAFSWSCDDDPGGGSPQSCRVPESWLDILDDDPDAEFKSLTWVGFTTPESASAAMLRTAVAWGRSLAGLPPLPAQTPVDG